MEAHFNMFRYGANLNTRFVHGLGQTCNRLRTFWAHPVELLGDVRQVETRVNPFGDNVNHGAR
jgi:hypothetical protein